MTLTYSRRGTSNAAVELVRVNGMRHCYIRPITLRGYAEVGVHRAQEPHRDLYGLLGVGEVSGQELDEGVDVCVSSWNRLAPNTLPAMAKAAANYMNSQLIRMEAEINGYAEGIALDTSGIVSEGSGENIFVVGKARSTRRRSAPPSCPASPAIA